MNTTAHASELNKPMLICFHANYSGSFHLMQPLIHDLQEDYKEDLNIVLIEKGEDLSLEKEYNINFFTTLLLIWKNEEIVRFHGLVNREELYSHINKLIFDIYENTKQAKERK